MFGNLTKLQRYYLYYTGSFLFFVGALAVLDLHSLREHDWRKHERKPEVSEGWCGGPACAGTAGMAVRRATLVNSNGTTVGGSLDGSQID